MNVNVIIIVTNLFCLPTSSVYVFVVIFNVDVSVISEFVFMIVCPCYGCYYMFLQMFQCLPAMWSLTAVMIN